MGCGIFRGLVARGVFPPEQVAGVKAIACQLPLEHGLPLSGSPAGISRVSGTLGEECLGFRAALRLGDLSVLAESSAGSHTVRSGGVQVTP